MDTIVSARDSSTIPRPLRLWHARQTHEASSGRSALQSLSSFIAELIVKRGAEGTLSFREVGTEAEWREVGKFRREQYRQHLPYMLSELDSGGADAYDGHSAVFVAWWNDRPAATVRLTPYPFETARYLSEERLARFLGEQWRSRYLEWTRLIVDPTIPVRRLMPAIIAFAGLQALSTTSYRKYFGYVSSKVKDAFERFALAADTEPFIIPSRGQHLYTLLQGQFGDSLESFLAAIRNQAAASPSSGAGAL